MKKYPAPFSRSQDISFVEFVRKACFSTHEYLHFGDKILVDIYSILCYNNKQVGRCHATDGKWRKTLRERDIG